MDWQGWTNFTVPTPGKEGKGHPLRSRGTMGVVGSCRGPRASGWSLTTCSICQLMNGAFHIVILGLGTLLQGLISKKHLDKTAHVHVPQALGSRCELGSHVIWLFRNECVLSLTAGDRTQSQNLAHRYRCKHFKMVTPSHPKCHFFAACNPGGDSY